MSVDGEIKMKAGGGSPEKIDENPVKRISLDELEEYAAQIRSLGYNALESNDKPVELWKREQDLDEIHKSLIESKRRHPLYVLEKKGTIEAFMVLETEPSGQDKQVTIKDVWVRAPDPSQEAVIEELIAGARKELKKNGYEHLHYSAKGPTDGFTSATGVFHDFLREDRLVEEKKNDHVEKQTQSEAQNQKEAA